MPPGLTRNLLQCIVEDHGAKKPVIVLKHKPKAHAGSWHWCISFIRGVSSSPRPVALGQALTFHADKMFRRCFCKGFGPRISQPNAYVADPERGSEVVPQT